MLNNDVSSNIWKFYVVSLLGGFAFFYNAIETLYYRHFGLSFQQIGWIISMTLVVSLILEIPTGAFADLYGKKKSLIMASIANLVGTICIALGSTFSMFLAGFAFWGVGRAFNSGASSALLFDTLKKLGRKKEFLKHAGRLSSFFISIDVLSGALAPLLFSINVRLPYFISLGAAVMMVLVQLSMHEVLEVRGEVEGALRDNWKQMVGSIKEALRSKFFIWLTAFSLLFFTANTVVSEMIATPFLTKFIGYTLSNLSVILVIGSIMQSGFVFFADRFEKVLGDKWSFWLIVLAFPATVFAYAYSHNLWLTALLTGVYFAAISFSEVVVESYLSHRVSDDKRATILSVSSMVVSTCALVALPIVGAGVDRLGLQTSLVVLSFVVGSVGLVLVSMYSNGRAINREG